jgi:hypothetical protein
MLLLLAIATVVSGYSLTRHLTDRYLTSLIHLWTEIFFIGTLITHILLSLAIPFYWSNIWKKIRSQKATPNNWLRIIQRLSGYTMVFFALIVILAGLNWYGIGLGDLLPFTIHRHIEIYLILLIILHSIIGLKFALARKQIKGPLIGLSLAIIIIFASMLVVQFDAIRPELDLPPENGGPIERNVRVTINDEIYTFDPNRIVTVRPDIFQPGHFSIFDILVFLDNESQIELEYHFDPTANTHIIDSLNGIEYWWYWVYYDGGWVEHNVFRMDHYPWKEQSTVNYFLSTQSEIGEILGVFRNEIAEREAMGDTLIIPEVTINGLTLDRVFYNVSVTPHNLRNDVFQRDVITAIDVIMSMGDQGLIDYELNWYDSIGDYAGVVRSYWVETIDNDTATGGCGFVYECGSRYFRFFGGNHIHLPSDTRVINAPQYLLWFWICL